jgi:hypothetical protein
MHPQNLADAPVRCTLFQIAGEKSASKLLLFPDEIQDGLTPGDDDFSNTWATPA